MMETEKHKHKFPANVYKHIEERGFGILRPCQIKAIDAGLFDNNNLLVCTPTASGKTLVAELAALHTVLNKRGKAVYLVPMKALATEKYRAFQNDYPELKIGISSGDRDSADEHLHENNVIIATSEKFDSLLRHRPRWLSAIKVLIIDEIHLLNDASRGPTLEFVITLMRDLIKDLQLIGLSATIGNPEELSTWLDAKLIIDNWRPVQLKKGIYKEGKIKFTASTSEP